MRTEQKNKKKADNMLENKGKEKKKFIEELD